MVATTMAASMYAEEWGRDRVWPESDGGSECLVSRVRTRRAGGEEARAGVRDAEIKLSSYGKQTAAIQARGRND